MIFRPNALHIERLATLLLFGFIIWFAFNAGYWRHDDPPSSTPKRIFYSFALSDVNKIKHLA